MRALLEEGPPLQPSGGLAVGYETQGGEPVGLFVLHYFTNETAVADLPARRALAAEGVSVVTRAPYREEVFTVREAAVEGTSIVLRVVYRRDLVFAICP